MLHPIAKGLATESQLHRNSTKSCQKSQLLSDLYTASLSHMSLSDKNLSPSYTLYECSKIRLSLSCNLIIDLVHEVIRN